MRNIEFQGCYTSLVSKFYDFSRFPGLILKNCEVYFFLKSNQDSFKLILLQWKRLFDDKLLHYKLFNNICIKVKNNSVTIILFLLLLQIEHLKNNDSLTIYFKVKIRVGNNSNLRNTEI